MNIITFNDVFEKAFCAFEDKKNWPVISRAPLFVHELEFQHSLKRYLDEGRETLNGNTSCPYRRFRLCLTLRDDRSSVRSEEHYLVGESRDGFIIYYFVAKHDVCVHKKPNVLMRFELCRGDEKFSSCQNQIFWVVGQDRWIGKREYIERLRHSDVLTYGSSDPEKLVDDSAICSVALIGTFIMDVMTPSNYIATVRPDQPGRSVQWTEQRTHYTLIHHGHPANRKEVTEGQDVAVDRQEEITRMAHGRRAHYRTLKSDRFRFARGKTVFVRAAWVGPKEWKEKGSKQIYRILEPVVL